jgi:mRNA-degrading endonuclease RelE of RelBE toxin-antitoxin system
MRFSRHAKNQARQLKADITDAEAVIAHPLHVDWDRRGKPRYTGRIRGVRVRIVVALDEPDLIVTIHERRR